MRKKEQLDWMIGSLRTLAALVGVLLLAFGAAPGVLAAGTQAEVEQEIMQTAIHNGSNATLIWGIVIGVAALGVIIIDVVHQKQAADRMKQK